VAAGQQSSAELRRPSGVTDPSRSRRSAESGARRAVLGGPAFINDLAEEQHHLDQIHDASTDPMTKATARLELARLYERHGHFAEAVEMYERNVWDGVRTPATYAGLAAAYRELGRHDLADAALEQVRRNGGAANPARAGQTSTTAALPRTSRTRTPGDASRARPAAEPLRSRSSDATRGRPAAEPARSRSAVEAARPADTQRLPATRSGASGRVRGATPRSAVSQRDLAVGGATATLRQLQDTVSPFLAGQAGRRTLVATTIVLPIAVGLGIFVAVVLSSARPRANDQVAPTPVAAAPSPAPVAPAPTSVIPAVLADQPTARLIVDNAGADGVSLRKTAGTTGQRIKVWPDGTEMTDLGDPQTVGGQTWRQVRDPDGNVGWTSAQYLVDPTTRGDNGPPTTSRMGAPAAPAAPAFSSGGLGLSRTEWEKAHGQPSRSSIFLEYDGGRLVVGLLDSNVWYIERVWMRNEAVDIDAARDDVKAYLPSDATVTQTVDKGDGKVIDIYSSSLLSSRFGPTAWNGGKVGTFTITYKFRAASDRMVVSGMFRLGDAQP
jgi:hypothetical protein